MAKVKTKISVKPVVKTTKDMEKEALMIKANKLIEKIKAMPVSQDFICAKMEVSAQSLSRFLNAHKDYVTTSMVSKVEAFVKQCEEDPSVFFKSVKK